MAKKYYQVNSTVVAPFVQEGLFRFRVGFERDLGDGTKQLCNQRKCPILSVEGTDGCVATSNPYAQIMLENFMTPDRSRRNGDNRPSGLAFVALEEAPEEFTDLDPIFDGV